MSGAGNPEEAAALGNRRGEAIEKTGAEIVITSCPFCEFHIMGHTKKPVKNIASVLLKRVPGEGPAEGERAEALKALYLVLFSNRQEYYRFNIFLDNDGMETGQGNAARGLFIGFAGSGSVRV